MKKLKKILKHLFFIGNSAPQLESRIIYGENSERMSRPSIDIRQKKTYTEPRVYIGNDSCINARLVFESDKGIIKIGDRVFIGSSTIISINEIEFENDIYVAWGCWFYDHDSHSIDFRDRIEDRKSELNDLLKGEPNSIVSKDWSTVRNKKIKICSHAWIGMNVIVLKGVTIGEGAIVGAGSVVTKDVEPWTVVAGNPASVVKTLNKTR